MEDPMTSDLQETAGVAEPGTFSDQASHDTDQIAYLQALLDRAHAEIDQYRQGFVGEIRQPLLMELVVLAHAVEDYLNNDDGHLTVEDYRNFVKLGVLGDILQALARYNVEPFITATQSVNRRVQTVDRVEETDDPRQDG